MRGQGPTYWRGMASTGVSCTKADVLCDGFDGLHTELDAWLWNQIHHLFCHTPYTESESPPTELKTSHAVHITP